MKNKIIDCILFYDEIEMLIFRLTELDEFVDYFIIMECDLDFKGNSKKLYFEENKELFNQWENKIIHIVSQNISKDDIYLI
jgi:beta-1,4-mannosyl-glycoprotein beta-1,4-N-acetylglucosaminyltransferase